MTICERRARKRGAIKQAKLYSPTRRFADSADSSFPVPDPPTRRFTDTSLPVADPPTRRFADSSLPVPDPPTRRFGRASPGRRPADTPIRFPWRSAPVD